MDLGAYKKLQPEYIPNRQLLNLKEDFWSEKIIFDTECPFCEQKVEMLLTVTKKSCRLSCPNEGCKKLFFYRVNLGVIE